MNLLEASSHCKFVVQSYNISMFDVSMVTIINFSHMLMGGFWPMWLCMLVVWPSILCNDQCYCVYKILDRTFRTVIVCTSPNFVIL